jgi:hypothetical protein
MMRKEENPVNQLMADGMQIEGGMSFSMAMQPLCV